MPVFDATNDYWLDDIRDTAPSATDAAQAAIEHRAGRHEPSERNRFNDMLKTAPAPVEEAV